MSFRTPYQDRPFRRTLIAVGAAVGVHLAVFGAAAWFFKDYIVQAGASSSAGRVTQRALEEAAAESPLVTQGIVGIPGPNDPNYSFEQVPISSGWDQARFLPASEIELPFTPTWIPDRTMMNAMPTPEQVLKKPASR